MIEFHKCTHGLYDKNANPFIKMWSDMAPRVSQRGHNLKLYPQYAKYDIRKYSFALTVTSKWNSLPEQVVNAPSLNSFKNRLDKINTGLNRIYCMKTTSVRFPDVT